MRQPTEAALGALMSRRNRILVLLTATLFFAVVSAILSVIVGLIGAYFRYGSAEIGGNDKFIEWSLLIFGLLSCAALYEIWKMMAEDRERSN
jgi:ABC-type Fe3+ transport system permease subunit